MSFLPIFSPILPFYAVYPSKGCVPVKQQLALYEKPAYNDPNFPIIFHEDYMTTARPSVYPHWHTGVELLYCIKGTGKLLQGSGSTVFTAGDLVVINSNAIHTLHMVQSPCLYYCLNVDPALLAPFGLFVQDDTHFSPIVKNDKPIGYFKLIVAAFENRDLYHRSRVMANVLMLFVELLLGHTLSVPLRREQNQKNQQMVISALDYIRQNITQSITVDEVSRHVGMSKYYFSRQFSAYTGMSVLHTINALKCNHARKLIQEKGFNVSEAAHHLGFQNLSYFSRLYKKHQGILPSKERNHHHNLGTATAFFSSNGLS